MIPYIRTSYKYDLPCEYAFLLPNCLYSKEAGGDVRMSRSLIIAEKPSAARAIAEALGGFTRRNGYLESDRYLLGWAVGHLVELKSPEEYDPRYKRWSLESLPILPRFGLRVIDRGKAQFALLCRLAAQADELINACDAGREGELIFRYIVEMGGLQLPTRRLWVSSLTKEAIRRAFGALRPQAEYDRLYRSALCRSQGDWLVGMNATRAFTVRWGELLSVGRVQTPTLALLVRREREITSFVSERYWEVQALFQAPAGPYPGKWFGPDGDRLPSAEAAKLIQARCEGRPAVVESCEERPAVERPPGLYDLTTLQREANRRFGLTAAATLKAAQELYEARLITYPRTDSRYLTRDMVRTLPKVVESLGAAYPALVEGARLDLVHPGNRRVVDDRKVSDHHAIIPTGEGRPPAGVQGRVYDLIARRFLAQFYPEARFLETEVITRVLEPGDRFRSRGRQVVDVGWQVCEPPPQRRPKKKGEGADEEEAPPLPLLRANESAVTEKVEVQQKQTQPPRRYTEAALLGAMETAGREIDDEALKEAMKGRGLGTPATRAATIERLKDVGYVKLEKKALHPAEKGMQLIERAESIGAQVMLSAELTGEWEKRIADIQAGAQDPDQFMAEIRALTEQVVRLAKAGAPTSRKAADNAMAFDGPESLPPVAGKCPRCGRAVIKKSRDWACLNDDCAVRVPVFLCGKVLEESHVAALLEKGRTPLITDFRSKAGKPFRAYLVLNGATVTFEFPPSPVRRRTDAAKPKASGGTGYRRGAVGGKGDGRAVTTKTGSRKAGGGGGRRSGGGSGL